MICQKKRPIAAHIDGDFGLLEIDDKHWLSLAAGYETTRRLSGVDGMGFRKKGEVLSKAEMESLMALVGALSDGQGK
jgi:hypothetical protein